MDNRYVRQTIFEPIGKQGQRKLSQSTVTIIGCGALGTANAESLVRAGIGKINLVDHDYVELSNLHRQQLFTEQDVHQMTPKVVAAKERLLAIRSDIELSIYMQYADPVLMERLTKESDIIIDATDNFETRLVINDAAYKYKIPWIYGACVGSTGAVFPFIPPKDPCFRCLLPVLPSFNETCDTAGIISPTVQVVAAIQSAETLKLLTDNHKSVRKRVFHFDVWNNNQLEIGISQIKQPHCKTCSDQPTYPSLFIEEQQRFRLLCGGNTIQVLPGNKRNVTLDEIKVITEKEGLLVKATPYFVMFLYKKYRMIVFENGQILIHGLKNANQARKILVELFG